MMKTAKTVFKIILSFWIFFHIFAMLIMPNLSSYLGRISSRWITPYANTIGLNASWNFFSPDPAHTMYIQYRVDFLNELGEELKESITHYIPAEKNEKILNPLHKRELYAMRFFAIDPKRMRTLLAPWICRHYTGATSVEVELVVETVPVLDQVVMSQVERVKDLSQEMQYSKINYSCLGPQDEEIL